jgi:hypothetical protein
MRRQQILKPAFQAWGHQRSLRRTRACYAILVILFAAVAVRTARAELGGPIRISQTGQHFVNAATGQRFVVWGVNYDHDDQGRLLDEYWIDQWDQVVEDFEEIKALGANCVRIHLQLGLFMEAPDRPRQAALDRLAKLVALAERNGLFLNITGLACYHKQHIPAWYDALTETQRWRTQAAFWEAVAKTCRSSPAIFCYDLMNEPILPGKEPASEWLAGAFGGKHFVQRIALDADGRSREQIALQWTRTMVEAIRRHDPGHLVTVGVIPWVFVFDGKGKPLFYSPPVAQHLDFVSVHFYPRAGELDAALEALEKYEIGKPLVVEEMFPLRCSPEELERFVRRSADRVDGWFSFYLGKTAEQLRQRPEPSIAEGLTADWLERFAQLAEPARRGELNR